MGNEQAILADREPRVHRITVEEFLALDQAGFFAEVGRVELIEGRIFEMAPLHQPHARALATLTIDVGNAVRALARDLTILSPVSARLDPNSLPEADLILAVPSDAKWLPAAAIRLAVEVADSSLRYDLGPKARLYAGAGVPEYWVADVAGRRIIRMHAPEGDGYRERTDFAFGAAVPSATIAGLTVDTSRLD